MSTRCQIAFYESKEKPLNKFEVLMYKHSDGYPDTTNGVVKLITPFLKTFAKERGLEDVEYASANLMHFMIQERNVSMAKWNARMVKSYARKYAKAEKAGNKSEMKMYKELHADYKKGRGIGNFIGFGICGDRQIHGDIEYFYRIYPDALEVYEVTRSQDMKQWKLLKTVPLKAQKKAKATGVTLIEQPTIKG